MLHKLFKSNHLSFKRKVYLLFSYIFPLLRCLIFYRKFGFVGRNSKIVSLSKFHNTGFFNIAENCKVDCYGKDGIYVGNNFKLSSHSVMSLPGSILSKGLRIEIGNNVGIGEFAYIGGEGSVFIGCNTIIGQYFSVHPENHVYNSNLNFIQSGTISTGIHIGSDNWIGSKVSVLDGVRIGNKCIIAAGSVVTKSFPDYSLIAGVPAKLIRSLK